MLKREQFAVSLRKQKTKNLIAQKRKRMMKCIGATAAAAASVAGLQMDESVANDDIRRPEYVGYSKFKAEGQQLFNQLLAQIAPQLGSQRD